MLDPSFLSCPVLHTFYVLNKEDRRVAASVDFVFRSSGRQFVCMSVRNESYLNGQLLHGLLVSAKVCAINIFSFISIINLIDLNRFKPSFDMSMI